MTVAAHRPSVPNKLTKPSGPRLIYWNNIPSPQFVRRMNELSARSNLEVEALFNAEREPDRSWEVDPASWLFPFTYLGDNGSRRARGAVSRVAQARPDVLVSLYADAAYVAGSVAARVLRIPLVLHAQRTFPEWRPRGRFRELGKRAVFRLADAFQVSGEDAASYVRQYHSDARCYVVPEDFDPALLGVRANVNHRSALRTIRGLRGCVFLYVGRLWSGKGIDSLLEAFRQARARGVDASLVLVGDGVDEHVYRRAAASIPDVHFSGFVEGDKLSEWYEVADVFVFPTLGDPHGLVVQEAMACGLPVISSTNAGDIGERVEHGVNGLLYPVADAQALAGHMARLAKEESLRTNMGEASRTRALEFTTVAWAEAFERMIGGVLDRRARR
jgi:glycosyltransferase involved in cell wall biosynthesis